MQICSDAKELNLQLTRLKNAFILLGSNPTSHKNQISKDMSRGAGIFLPEGGEKFKKTALFLLKRHCQQKQILVAMLQFEILVDMIEFQFAQDRPVSRKSFILLICYFGSINFSANANSF